MRGQCKVGLDCLLNKLRALGLGALVDILAKVTVWPAVETTLLHRCHVVGNQIGADLVALIDNGPELTCLGLPLKPGWVPKARGEDSAGPGCNIDFQDGRAPVLHREAVLGDVAVRADADVELFAVGTRQQGLCPVVIYGARQVRQFTARVGDAGSACGICELHDLVGVCDVQRLAYQLQTEWRVQVLQKDVLLPPSGARLLAQKRDPVPAFRSFSGTALNHARNQLLWRCHRFGTGPVRFDDKHIAIGQCHELTRVLQVVCNLFDPKTARHRWTGVSLPSNPFRNLHRWDQKVLGRGQDRLASSLLLRVHLSSVLASAECQDQDRRNKGQPFFVVHVCPL